MSTLSPAFALILAAGLLALRLPGPPQVRAVLIGCVAGPFVPEVVARSLAIGLGFVTLAAAGLSCPPFRPDAILRVLRREAQHLTCGFVVGAGVLHALGASVPVSVFAGLLVGASGPLSWQRSSFVPALQALLATSLVLALPVLAQQEDALLESSRGFFSGVSFVTLVGIAGQRFVPRVVRKWTARGGMAAARIVVIAPICIALLAEWIGPGLATGAVLGGLLLHNDAQLTELLAGAQLKVSTGFALALGLLVDFQFLWAHVLMVTLSTGAVLLVHILVSTRRWTQMFNALHLVRVQGAPAYILFVTGAPLLFPEASAKEAAEALFVAVAALSLVTEALLRRVSAQPEEYAPPSPAHAPHSRLSRKKRTPASSRSRVTLLPSPDDEGRLRIVTVEKGAPAAGLSLRQLALRDRCGVQILALWRYGAYNPHPLPDLCLHADDRLLLLASPTCLQRSRPLFRKLSLGRQ